MSKFAHSLFGRVLIALILGIALGIFAPAFAVSLKPIGDGFIKLIQMIVAPLVFCVVVHGIAGGGDLKKVGRVGLKTIVYFEIVTTLALLIGMILAFALHPGQGMNIDAHSLDQSAMNSYVDRAKSMDNVSDFFLHLIPSTVGDAFAKGDILQVLVIAILFGAAVSLLGEKGKPVSVAIDYLSQVLFKIMRKLERLGIKESTVGLVIPTGYSFNLDGFSIYLTLAVVFIAQATNTPLSLHDLALVLLVSLVASKGVHGIPGSAIVILAATLSAVPAIPVIGLALLVPVDWFIGIGRALTNLLGNCVATLVVANWEKDIDREKALAVLEGTEAIEIELDAARVAE